jgi:hypothetical protein
VILLSSLALHVKITILFCGAENLCVYFAFVGVRVSHLGLSYIRCCMFLMVFNFVSFALLVIVYVCNRFSCN